MKNHNKTTYDPLADAVYIYGQQGEVARTVPINERVFVDVDKNAGILGIEILDASFLLGDATKLKSALVERKFHKAKISHKSEQKK